MRVEITITGLKSDHQAVFERLENTEESIAEAIDHFKIAAMRWFREERGDGASFLTKQFRDKHGITTK